MLFVHAYVVHLTPPLGVIPRTIFVIFGGWVVEWPGYNMLQNIPEKLNTLSRVHARHRRQTDRRTDGFAIAYSQT